MIAKIYLSEENQKLKLYSYAKVKKSMNVDGEQFYNGIALTRSEIEDLDSIDKYLKSSNVNVIGYKPLIEFQEGTAKDHNLTIESFYQEFTLSSYKSSSERQL